jgi:hypothetical protein
VTNVARTGYSGSRLFFREIFQGGFMDSSILDDTSSVINSVREIEKLAKKSESHS